jgi:hypothetical protein
MHYDREKDVKNSATIRILQLIMSEIEFNEDIDQKFADACFEFKQALLKQSYHLTHRLTEGDFQNDTKRISP